MLVNLNREGSDLGLYCKKISVIIICSDKNEDILFYAYIVAREENRSEWNWAEHTNIWLYPAWTDSI